MDNNDLSQIVLLVSAAAGCLGTFALLRQLSWPPLWLAWILAAVVGYVYGEIQTAILFRLPRIRDRGEPTASCLCKVGCPFFIIVLCLAILSPIFQEAREKARAPGHVPPEFPSWVPLAAVAFPVVLSGIIAVVGWGLHVSERRRGRR